MRRILFTTLFFFALAMSLLNANASESAELHWSVCEKSSDVILKKLGLKIKEVEERTVSYQDIWNEEQKAFVYHSKGLVFRIRNEEGKFKSTVKIKFESRPQFTEEWEGLVKCEKDLYTTKESYFCSLSEESNIFSENQKAFVKAYREEPKWEFLNEHGPAANTVWKMKSGHSLPKLELEELVLKDGGRIYEISTRSDAREARKEHERVSEILTQKNLRLCEVQESKTRLVLESYSVDSWQ